MVTSACLMVQHYQWQNLKVAGLLSLFYHTHEAHFTQTVGLPNSHKRWERAEKLTWDGRARIQSGRGWGSGPPGVCFKTLVMAQNHFPSSLSLALCLSRSRAAIRSRLRELEEGSTTREGLFVWYELCISPARAHNNTVPKQTHPIASPIPQTAAALGVNPVRDDAYTAGP